MKNLLTFTLISFLLLLATPALWAESDSPEVSIEGLTLVDKDRRGEIYAEDGIDWSEYSQIQLERATVSFRKNWQRDQNRYNAFKVRDQDMQRIKTGLADLFDDVFRKELSEDGGYTMTDGTGPDVMRLVPRIVDLDVAAPDTHSAGRTKSYTDRAGRMTLILEVYDSQSGDIIAKASHRQDAPQYGYVRWSNSVSNTAEARRMLQRWASGLVERLDDAREATAGNAD